MLAPFINIGMLIFLFFFQKNILYFYVTKHSIANFFVLTLPNICKHFLQGDNYLAPRKFFYFNTEKNQLDTRLTGSSQFLIDGTNDRN